MGESKVGTCPVREAEPPGGRMSGHLFCLPAPKHERYRFLELCFLRHPLDRLQSAYHYTRRLENTDDINVAQARALSLPDYLLWLRENQPYNLINVQTCVLGNRGRYFFPPSPYHLEPRDRLHAGAGGSGNRGTF